MTMNRHSMQDAIKLNNKRQLCDNCRTSVKANGQIPLQVRLSGGRFDYQLWKNYQIWKNSTADIHCSVVVFSWEQVLEAKVRCRLCNANFKEAAESQLYADFDRSTCVLAVKYKSEDTNGIHSMSFMTNHSHIHLLWVTICPSEYASSEGNMALPMLDLR